MRIAWGWPCAISFIYKCDLLESIATIWRLDSWRLLPESTCPLLATQGICGPGVPRLAEACFLLLYVVFGYFQLAREGSRGLKRRLNTRGRTAREADTCPTAPYPADLIWDLHNTHYWQATMDRADSLLINLHSAIHNLSLSRSHISI